MRISLGADHAGFALKENVKGFLLEQGHEVLDVGTDSEAPVDYPPFCAAAAREVIAGRADRAMLFGGSGQGEQIAANKIHGIRAALCNDLFAARNAREHNDANVLTVGGRIIGIGLAQEIAKVFVTTAFASRHQPRIDKISEYEQDLLRAAAGQSGRPAHGAYR